MISMETLRIPEAIDTVWAYHFKIVGVLGEIATLRIAPMSGEPAEGLQNVPIDFLLRESGREQVMEGDTGELIRFTLTYADGTDDFKTTASVFPMFAKISPERWQQIQEESAELAARVAKRIMPPIV